MKIEIVSEKYEIQFQSPGSYRDDLWLIDGRCPKVTNLGEGLAILKYNENIFQFKKIGCKFRLVKITEEVIADSN